MKKRSGLSFDRIFGADDRAAAPERSAGGAREIRGLPPGEYIGDGVYRVISRRAFGSPHGDAPLVPADDHPAAIELGAAGRVVCLDLETTGLSRGAGTYAFLCGLGYADGGDFVVAQFFLTGPAREARWLAAIDEAIPPGSAIVTYNGASFDMPLLRTRCVLARTEPAWAECPHIDALPLARRLYRASCGSCSLGNLERVLLGVRRAGEDIPGALIPGIYREYLATGDASPLAGVFYHNEIDIVSLASLYRRIAGVLWGETGCGIERLRASEIWRRAGRSELAGRLLDEACEDESCRAEATLARAYRMKAARDYAGARAAFTAVLGAIADGGAGRALDGAFPEVCVELAKLEEHRFGDLERAAYLTREAGLWLKRARYAMSPRRFAEEIGELRRRYERLARKIRAKSAKEAIITARTDTEGGSNQ